MFRERDGSRSDGALVSAGKDGRLDRKRARECETEQDEQENLLRDIEQRERLDEEEEHECAHERESESDEWDEEESADSECEREPDKDQRSETG